jgi:hypothetical protein
MCKIPLALLALQVKVVAVELDMRRTALAYKKIT